MSEEKENERIRTMNTYNLELFDYESSSKGFWEMPVIDNDNYIPSDLIGFNYDKTSQNKNCGMHFYLDDYQFERIWNIYRSRLIGQFYQRQGIKVIPTISWAEIESFDYCFQGISKGSVVSISTIGVKNSSEALKMCKSGMNEMIKRIKPSAILVYGGKLDYDYKDIKVIYCDNRVTENMKNATTK